MGHIIVYYIILLINLSNQNKNKKMEISKINGNLAKKLVNVIDKDILCSLFNLDLYTKHAIETFNKLFLILDGFSFLGFYWTNYHLRNLYHKITNVLYPGK